MTSDDQWWLVTRDHFPSSFGGWASPLALSVEGSVAAGGVVIFTHSCVMEDQPGTINMQGGGA